MPSDQKLKITVKLCKKPHTANNVKISSKAKPLSPIISTLNSPIRIIKTVKSQSNICFPLRTPKPSLDPKVPKVNFPHQPHANASPHKEILHFPSKSPNNFPKSPSTTNSKNSPLYIQTSKPSKSTTPQIRVNLLYYSPKPIIKDREPSPILKSHKKSSSMTEEDIKDLRVFLYDLNK